jgi:hypothetical protein
MAMSAAFALPVACFSTLVYEIALRPVLAWPPQWLWGSWIGVALIGGLIGAMTGSSDPIWGGPTFHAVEHGYDGFFADLLTREP